MKRLKIQKNQTEKATLVLIILFLSFFPTYLANINTSNYINAEKEADVSNETLDMETLKLSALGNNSWWNYSFRYRSLIEITNPYALNFTDYGVSASFNYSQLLEQGKIYQNDLDDIRIVENRTLRSYYLVQDYPENDLATIYFDTNISQSTTELDTYMYFGNDTVGNAEADDYSNSFGWVKNGDFELDTSPNDKYNPFGWTFTHEPINYLGIVSGDNNPYPNAANESAISYEYFRNKPIHISECDPNYETDPPPNWDTALRVENGEYSYVWGSNLNALGGIGTVFDYAGTFYSYPFKVPIVEGGALYLRVYRNVRTWRFEKRDKPQDDIDRDGFFIRLCNVSSYGSDVDSHVVLGTEYVDPEYVDVYGGHAVYSPSGKTWSDEDYMQDHVSPTPPYYQTLSHTYNDGDLTGTVYYDITSYMGQEIFLEAGAWGEESGDLPQEAGEKQGIFQLDYIGFNYTLTASIDEVQAHNSTITVVARDVDGSIVPNAEVMLINNSIPKGTPGYEVASGTTDAKGRITFAQIPNGKYNITANYTLGSREAEVFNSYNLGTGPYYLNGISYTKEIQLNLWTIDFEIVDWDGIPLSMGYIEVNESGGDLLSTLTLNQYGKARFRWLNEPSYYFSVYYDNPDDGEPLLLNESYIYRSDYDKEGIKYQDYSIWVNKTNTDPPGASSYSISEYIYSNGSRTEFGNQKLIKASISLSDMNNQLEDISIYYIDRYESTGTSNHLIYFEDGYGPGEDSDFIELDFPLLKNIKLKSENYEVYGLYIEVNGLNFTQCNGKIEIETIESCNIYNRTHLARINIQTVDEFGNPISSIVRISETSPSQSLINLSASSTTTNGYAYDTSDYPFWYLKDRMYNFTIDAYNLTNTVFDVQYINPPQLKPLGVTWFNFTLQFNSTIKFKVYLPGVNTSYFLTSFTNSSGTEDAYWGESLTFSVIFEYTEDDGVTWDPVTNPSAHCKLYIRRVGTSTDLIEEFMTTGTGAGNFTITLNSSRLSAGGEIPYYLLYNIRIEGSYPGYPDPNSEGFLLELKAIPTAISAHDHDTQLELTVNIDGIYETSVYYDELISIMIKYSINESGFPLDGAYLTYEWLGLQPVRFYADYSHAGFYTFTIDSSDAQTTGLKAIRITGSYENYTTQSILIHLTVLERESTLNDKPEDLYYISSRVYVQDQRNFVFTYRDANTNDIIGDLNVFNYLWEELYENGTKIPGSFGSGTLTQIINDSYVLDFNTELKPVGYYFLYVTLKRDNYVQKNAFIYLEIMLREFSNLPDAIESPELGNNFQLRINKGDYINFRITLRDTSRGNILLQGATVKLYMDQEYSFNETSAGVYELTLSTANINTFIAPKTFSAVLSVEMANFTSQQLQITITVKMEEIWPGMPTFYFILIFASIAGVVGSVVAYRVIQRARIPKYVKKIRKVKGLMKSKKKIADVGYIPTKAQMTAELFGDDWKEIGLSLEEVLGIQDLKSKKLPTDDKIAKEGGVNE